jgi:hypothetical protein
VPECQRALDQAIKQEADHYINEYLGDPEAAGRVDVPLEYLRQQVKRAEFSEVVESTSVGPMHQIHALLQFDDAARTEFSHRLRESKVTERLSEVGRYGAAVLGTLGVLYGFLKWNLRRRTPTSGSRAALTAALIVALGAIATRLTVGG